MKNVIVTYHCQGCNYIVWCDPHTVTVITLSTRYKSQKDFSKPRRKIYYSWDRQPNVGTRKHPILLLPKAKNVCTLSKEAVITFV